MDFTLSQMWIQMGIVAKVVVAVLAVMSIFTVAVSVERLVVFGRAQRQSRRYARKAREALENRRYKEACDMALRLKASHVASVIGAALTEFVAAAPDGALSQSYDVLGAVQRAIEKTIARQNAILRRGLSGLATVGSTAPFVGLFGTTFGIINAFQGMAREGGGGLGAIAAGIAEALITTAVGIGVAVVAVLLYNYFTAHIEEMQVDANESGVEVVDLMLKHYPQLGASNTYHQR
ncbi:MAG: MotA/TolQ/ExbB proton channel family protein [Myxococcota bacterium]|jgi:biopolymer transport protein ExbB/TolQ|nr:MotA/TolQ/ExbB proton channel family protein [Myxococcota bacterium]